jgi:uncharacterized surface protein with fasciclin (FAS1) repeats
MSTTKCVALFFILASVACAFQSNHPVAFPRLSSSLKAGTSVEAFLAEKYPAFLSIVSKNAAVMKLLRESTGKGCTIFAPNSKAFEDLGDKKRMQLADDRNYESVEKIGAYHVVAEEAVTAEKLFASGGVVTLGGIVDVGRSVSGGFFGVGGKEDGGVTINGAKVIESFELGDTCIVHEVDCFISPQLLWRYVDQLRIPFSS